MGLVSLYLNQNEITAIEAMMVQLNLKRGQILKLALRQFLDQKATTINVDEKVVEVKHGDSAQILSVSPTAETAESEKKDDHLVKREEEKDILETISENESIEEDILKNL
jgi:hypothetical protein